MDGQGDVAPEQSPATAAHARYESAPAAFSRAVDCGVVAGLSRHLRAARRLPASRSVNGNPHPDAGPGAERAAKHQAPRCGVYPAVVGLAPDPLAPGGRRIGAEPVSLE